MLCFHPILCADEVAWISYIGGFISRLATLGTRWDMHFSRKILIKHFAARAAEYDEEITNGIGMAEKQDSFTKADEPVRPTIHYLLQAQST